MSQEAEFAASADSRVKDLEHALLATKHVLATAQACNRRLRDEMIELIPFADVSPDGARAAASARSALMPLVADKYAGRVKRAEERAESAEKERDAMQGDLRRVTEERNAARESLRAQAFELQLLRDEPAERRLATVTADRDELARRLAELDAAAAAQLHEACDLLEAKAAGTKSPAEALSLLLEAAEQQAAGIQLPAEEWFAVRDYARAALAEVAP